MLRVLSHPLPVILAVQIALIAMYWLRRRNRGAMIILSITVLLLTALSMPVVAGFLQESLALPDTETNITPDYVVVLAGGLSEGATPDLDVLAIEATKRVLYGVRYWKAHPSARLVFTGAGPGLNRARETELMAEVARCNGVPDASMILEPRAMSTREHPIRLRAMPGFSPASRLAIVTSRWHERRAMTEFHRYFMNVTPVPVPVTGADSWRPDVGGLRDSTDATREWVAVVWYRVRAAIEKR